MAELSKEFLAAVGEVTLQFAMLERQLESATWSLLVGAELRDQPTARVITAELSFQRTLQLFASMFRHRFPEVDDAELRSVSAELSSVEAERNTIVHSTWALAEDGKVIRFKTTAKGELKTKSEKLEAADVQAVAQRIHTAAERILNFDLSLHAPGHGWVKL